MSKKGQKNTKKKNELKVIFFIILISAVLFIISTYAWFSTQKNVSITNLEGTVEVAEGLEISIDAETWSNGISIGEGEGQVDLVDDAYANNKNLIPTEMLPVSTLGLVSEKMTDIKMLRGKISNSKTLSEIIQASETVTDSNNELYSGFFAFDIFLKNSSNTTGGKTTDILQLNYDSSLEIKDAEKTATGLQNTLRVGFALYDGTVDVGESDAETILNGTVTRTDVVGGDTPRYISSVAIWEPNSSDHAEYIVKNNNRLTWSSTDKALYGNVDLDGDAGSKVGFGRSTQMPTYALTEATLTAIAADEDFEIADIYNWDLNGTGSANKTYLAKQNTLQTTNFKDDEDDEYAVTSYRIKEGVKNLKSTSDGTTDFTIPANTICRLRVYVWLEGQDVDCINYASYGGGVKLNIGLVKGSTEGTFGEEGS